MATSLYGTVKKINQSCFVFDKIYNTRADMEANKNTDGVYHSRYVLVTYGERYSLIENANPITNENGDIPNQGQVYSANANLTETWTNHYNTDIRTYGNQYDNTVWQKIYEGSSVKYIMVASLNARAPGLTINEDYYSFTLESDDNSNDVFYTKYLNNDNTYSDVQIHDGDNENNHQPKMTAHYPIPKWHETISNDLIYHLDMPMPLRINLANDPEYFKDGLNPAERSTYDSNDKNNYIRWEHILKSNTDNEVIGADFNFHVPGLGQALSDAYDALYGVPVDENGEPTTGARPSHENLDEVLEQTDYIGLLGILANLNLQGDTYYFHGDWDASSSDFGHIEHKPNKITNITVAEDGLWTITAVAQ